MYAIRSYYGTMKQYTFKLIIKEGCDEFWESIENKTGCDEVEIIVKGALDEYFPDEYELKLTNFEDK